MPNTRPLHHGVENAAGQAACQIDGQRPAAQFVDYPGDIDAASTGIIALVEGSDLAGRMDNLRLRRSVDAGVQGLMTVGFMVS